MSTAVVDQIIHRIEELPEEERFLLEERLAELEEAAWKREAEKARLFAKTRGIDQAAIDRAFHELRHSQ